MIIDERSRVTLHFELRLPTGEVIDSNFDAEPATLSIGDGNMLPGFEQVLLGLKAGVEKTVTVPAENGFGQSNPDNMQTFPREQLAGVCENVGDLVPGAVLSFADAARGELPGVVVAVSDTEVEVDFNHPLAGRDIVFRVSIVSIGTNE